MRPIFYANPGNVNLTYTTSLSQDASYATFNYLYVPNTAVGHIHLQGSGSNTVINTAPDHGGVSQFLAVGYRQRPNDATNITQIQPVAKGATQLTLVNSSNTFSLSAGQDIFLYSGSFTNTACPQSNSLPGTPGECHFSELNTIASTSGSTITLT